MDYRTYKALFHVQKVHSRDMKTQHIKFEILKERLSLLYCNLIRRDFVLKMFSIGQICNENLHAFGDFMDDVTKY